MEETTEEQKTVPVEQYKVLIKSTMEMMSEDRAESVEREAAAHSKGMWKMWRWYTVINVGVSLIFWLIQNL